MLSINELQGVVEQELQRLPIVSKPENLYLPIEYIMSLGGKRIRPVMCLAACQLFSGDFRKAIPAAIGIELFHNFTLLHDDIMDNAPMRRNHDTVHVKWNANTAILSGDAMMIKALQSVAQIDSPRFKEILDVFNTTALEVCEGQQYDMEFEQRDDVTEAEYLEMIRLKTAVLLAGSMKIGAIVGNASHDDAGNLYAFAQNIGLAFQLQDDLLDVYGDEAQFGKSIGGDIVANKKTYLLIKARELANGDQLSVLESWLHRTSFDRDEKIAAVRGVYDQLSVAELVRVKIDLFFQSAMQALDALTIEKEDYLFFKDFATGLIQRSR